MDKREFVKTSVRGGLIVGSAIVLHYAIGLTSQAILARMLDPKHFGQLAFVTIAAMFFNTFTNIHGDKFVVRERQDTHRNLDNVFTLELILASFFVVFVFLLAPLMMRLLGRSELTTYVQVLAFAFFYNPLIRPRCLLERNLSFFYSRFPLIAASAIAAGVAILMAYLGFGVWSLLCWRLTNFAGEVIIHWTITSYRPRLAWNTEIIKKAIRFGWPLMGSYCLLFFYYNVSYYIVGQTLPDGETQLGYYWLAFQISTYFLKTRQILHTVLFPIFSLMEDKARKARVFQKMTHAVAAVFLLLCMVMVFFGREIVLFFLGAKWEPSIFPFQVIFVTVLTRAINANSGYYLYSQGITKADLAAGIIYSVLLPPLAYFMTQSYGINGTAVAVLLVNFVTVSYVFTKYIKPLAGVGVLHFFLRPWLIAGATFALMYLAYIYDIALPIRLGVFALLLLTAYLSVFRQVVRDLSTAKAILAQK